MKWSKEAQQVHQYLRKKGLLKPEQTLLLAVSGGRDSVALLHILLELKPAWRWKLFIGHVNHGLRPDADAAESDGCRTMASEYQLPYFEKKLSSTDFDAVSENSSIEAKARILRYAILEKWRRESCADYILTGHHQDDQAETILYRFFQGSGWRGLAGIAIHGESIIRPLMALRRSEITSYCEKRQIKYFDDNSNENEQLKRNLIRRQLLPEIENHFPSAVQALNAMAESMQKLSEYADGETERFLKANLRKYDEFFRLSKAAILALPTLMQQNIIQKLPACLGNILHLSQKQTEQILNLLRDANSGALFSPAKDLFYFLETDDLVISKVWPQSFQISLEKDTICTLPYIGSFLLKQLAEKPKAFPKNDSKIIYASHSHSLKFCLRSWQKGDQLQPFGESKGRHISNILTNSEIPAFFKINYPVLLAEGQILWVPGLRRSNIFPIYNKARFFYQIHFFPAQNGGRDAAKMNN